MAASSPCPGPHSSVCPSPRPDGSAGGGGGPALRVRDQARTHRTQDSEQCGCLFLAQQGVLGDMWRPNCGASAGGRGACVHLNVGGDTARVSRRVVTRGVGSELVETMGGEPQALTSTVATPFAERDLPATDIHHPGGDGSHRARQRQGGPGLLHLPPVQWEGHLPAAAPGYPEA